MNEYIKGLDTLEKAIHLYNRVENKKRDFGLGYELSMKEIHTIQFIYDNPDTNLKSIALSQGVTNGASSQMITRLIKKGLVTKERKEGFEAEITLKLTAEGKRVYMVHEEFHEKDKFSVEALANKYTKEQWQNFTTILLDLAEYMTEVTKEDL